MKHAAPVCVGIIFINFTLISAHNFGGIIVSCLVSSACFMISTSSLRLIMLVTINAETGVDRFAHGYEFPPLLLLAALAGPPIAGAVRKSSVFISTWIVRVKMMLRHPFQKSCGVWLDPSNFTSIELFPGAYELVS